MPAPDAVAELKQAIDSDDLERVRALMMREPALHHAPLGYANDGPLTWVAECRFAPPSPGRLAIAEWMIANGSDIHQGGDGPLGRAALHGARIPMMDLLVRHGADVNARWHSRFPVVHSPCETLDSVALEWLLDHGANANPVGDTTAIDYAISTYVRSPKLARCIDLLLAAGGKTTAPDLIVALLRGRVIELATALDLDPAEVHRRWPNLNFGATGGRRLTLGGATLLHVAAEYGLVDAANLLLDRGADVNARAGVDADGVGGQTPLFHAATQFGDAGRAMLELLIERGAESIRARVPGHYERPGEILECTALEYAARLKA